MMYQWWNKEARPVLWRVKQEKAAAREELVLEIRRLEQERDAALSAVPPLGF